MDRFCDGAAILMKTPTGNSGQTTLTNKMSSMPFFQLPTQLHFKKQDERQLRPKYPHRHRKHCVPARHTLNLIFGLLLVGQRLKRLVRQRKMTRRRAATIIPAAVELPRIHQARKSIPRTSPTTAAHTSQ